MTLTLRKIAESIRTVDPVYVVMQRANGHWSPAAKAIAVTADEIMAQEMALTEKRKHPQQHYGVFALRSEARVIPDPVEIVKVPE